MRRMSDLRWKLLFLLGSGLLIWVWWRFSLPCVPRLLTGVICPGCGMTRAWEAALRLELSRALEYHPMFWSVPVFILFILFDGRLFRNARLNHWLLGGLAAAFFLCYVFRLIAFLGGELTI